MSIQSMGLYVKTQTTAEDNNVNSINGVVTQTTAEGFKPNTVQRTENNCHSQDASD
ncbi:MAG: hypothetical protein MUF58_10525 [Arcicella sp.]|nr:hypothetical protein [Arcicella sp.]